MAGSVDSTTTFSRVKVVHTRPTGNNNGNNDNDGMCINAHQQRDELHLLPSVVVLDGVVPKVMHHAFVVKKRLKANVM